VCNKKQTWIINIIGECFVYIFIGTKREAEIARKRETKTYGSIVLMRPYTKEEDEMHTVDECRNHYLFGGRKIYPCSCKNCIKHLRIRKLKSIL